MIIRQVDRSSKGSGSLCSFLLLASLLLLVSACAKQAVNEGFDKSVAAKKHIQAAKAYIDEGNTRKGLYHLKKSQEFEKSSLELFHTYALLYRTENDPKREEYYYSKALREDKKNAMVKNNYGSFLCFHGEPEKGIELLVEASEDYTYMSRAEAYVNRGLCELVLKDTQAAEKSFQQALRLNTKSSRPLIELVDIYLNRNDVRVADIYYQQFISKVGQQNARSLWLGIQLAWQKGDDNTASSYGLMLQKFYPSSDEYGAYVSAAKLR